MDFMIVENLPASLRIFVFSSGFSLDGRIRGLCLYVSVAKAQILFLVEICDAVAAAAHMIAHAAQDDPQISLLLLRLRVLIRHRIRRGLDTRILHDRYCLARPLVI